jgi:hypothetical protein
MKRTLFAVSGLILAVVAAVAIWTYFPAAPTGLETVRQPVSPGIAQPDIIPKIDPGSLPGPALAATVQSKTAAPPDARSAHVRRPPDYQSRYMGVDTSGFLLAFDLLVPWEPRASFEDVARSWNRIGYRNIESIDRSLAQGNISDQVRYEMQEKKASLYNYEGEPRRAYQVLEQLRLQAESDEQWASKSLYTVIFFQGVTGLRIGETENCIHCRGESSCILPISKAAVHTNVEGSRLAIRHFTEYLDQFPNDVGVRWLLNVAYMTLGEYPQQVDPRFRMPIDRFIKSEFDIGKFRDIGAAVGVSRFNQSGGAIMEDFDNDGLLDIAITTWDALGPMAFYHNNGEGAFEDRTAAAGLSQQFGGLYCVQTDYNNDGDMDIFIVRGAWIPHATRPSLLRNNGNGTFTDVTQEAGLLDPVNSISASWADYDNDGWLDLFICCERQDNRLYHNLRNGTFQEVAHAAGVDGSDLVRCKGASWIDYDNDGYQDLFLDYLLATQGSKLYHNNRDSTFAEVTFAMGIAGPMSGFSCWSWDYDNDGWLDLYASSYDLTLDDMVNGILAKPQRQNFGRLYRNDKGQRFEDKTREAGLDLVIATMGSNFGDFDNDGYLDMYLGTGKPALEFLDPSRMFKNVAGRRFAEITGTSGTGNLQKGHAVACGDWDRDGNTDIFIEMGGATIGDKYHNVLFQNPGQGNHWLTVKLVGQKTNRPAIGARIKVVTTGLQPLTVYRHISSGSSFGANTLQQTIGLAKAETIAELEIHWPTSGTTQVFRNLAVDQAIEVTEFANDYRKLDWGPIAIAE